MRGLLARGLLALALASCVGAAERPRARPLPPHHRALAENAHGGPEQVHLSLTGTPSEMLVLWASAAATDASAITVAYGLTASALDTTVYGGKITSYSQLTYYEPDILVHPIMDEVQLGLAAITAVELCRVLSTPVYQGGVPPSCNASSRPRTQSGVASNADHIYASPPLVSVLLQNLQPSQQYFYRIGGDAVVRSFRTLPPQAPDPGAYPLSVAMFADVGQTVVSAAVIKRLAADADTRLVLLSGDWSYADGYGPRWDSWERLMEPLAQSKPVMGSAGNHELERGEAFVPLLARHPTPYVASKSLSPLDYTFLAGPSQVIVLNSYAGARGLARQAEWLRGVLSRVDRRRTPWLIVLFHTSWYSSQTAKTYTRAGEPLRWSVEQLLYDSGVDIVLSGHIHAYERSYPVLNRTRDACGPTHLGVGDAGAHGGPMIGWKTPAPDWSAFRSASFGAGQLTVANATHAHWTWTRVACGKTNDTSKAEAQWQAQWDADKCSTTDDTSDMRHSRGDDAWIVRDVGACANKARPNGGRDEVVQQLHSAELVDDAADAPAADDDVDEDP